jgi:fructose-1,6-bisphosphatase I
MQLENSFTSFLLTHQQKHGRTLNFVLLMEALITAAKQIRHCYRMGELDRILGEAGNINIQGESVMQLDLLANQIVLHYLKECGQVIEATSEELEEPVRINDDGRYFVYFDPLDGSSNISHSLPVGFLFGIAKKNLTGTEDYKIRTGEEFIAAGMFLIPSGHFTFALKNTGAWRFIMDETGTYVRPQRLVFPENKKNWELSWNAANRYSFSDNVQNWIGEHERNYNFRYCGSLAVDFHRLIHNGGMFMYPAIVNHPDKSKNRPEGKLRLMYECNVVAYIAREAGGYAVDEQGKNILQVIPEKRHQRSSIYIGNREMVESLAKKIAPTD